MSFDVFASGSGGFHYQKDDFIDGDDFDALKIASEIRTLEPTKLGVVDAVRDHFLSKDMSDAMPVLARREFLYTLTESVDLLSTRASSATGFIALTAKRRRAFIDTIRFAKYSFDPGSSPGTEFFHANVKNLEDTGLNTWGVLMALTLVLSGFLDHLNARDASLAPMVNIFLTR